METDEFQKLAKVVSADLEAAAILMLMGYGGLRTVEVARLRIRDLDVQKRALWVTTAKHKKNPIVRLIPLDDDTFAALEKMVKGRKPDDGLVLYQGHPATRRRIRHLFHKVKRVAGVRDVLGPHSLRHLAGIIRTEAGASPQEVAAFLGHKKLDMVLVYSNLTENRNRSIADDALSALRGGRVTKSRK